MAPSAICEAAVHFITSVRRSEYALSTSNKDCSHSRSVLLLTWWHAVPTSILLSYLSFVFNSEHSCLFVFIFSMCLMISTLFQRVWFFCCVTVDAINDTMAAFYNETDLFSGEFWHPLVSTPQSPNSSLYPLTLTLPPNNPKLFTISRVHSGLGSGPL